MEAKTTSETLEIIEQEFVGLEPEWQKEYRRLGNFYAIRAAYLIIFTYPLGIFADIDFIPQGSLLFFLAIQLLPTALISIALIIRRLRPYRHEILVLIMAFSIFASASHKVVGQDLVYYLINNGLCFAASAVLMIVSPLYPVIIWLYVVLVNVVVEVFFYEVDLGAYFGRQGGIVISVIGFIFVLVAQFRYQILRNNFLNSLALKKSYELLAQKNRIIEENNQIIREINEDITDSINYAKRIQQAIFQFEDEIKPYLPEYFIFYRPRDIVSGDFYWFAKIPDYQKVIISAVDCTGHGVPGAFMSMLGAEILDKLVMEKEIYESDKILNQLHNEIRRLLKQKETGNQDGMDMALSVIDFEKKILDFSGARNPLVMIQNDTLQVIKPDKFPVGGFHSSHAESDFFSKQSLDISVPTTIYMFSDGFQDQFGGPKGKKFMVNKFHQLLFEIHQKPMIEQHKLLEETFINWMTETNQKQVDDVLVIGVKI